MYKIKKEKINTVKDLREALSKMPDDYTISCAGMCDFSMAIDDDTKIVLMDCDTYMSEEDFEKDLDN